MSKENKEENKIKKYYKKACKRYQDPPNKEKRKSDYMVMNVTKIPQKMKSKSFLSIERNIIEWEKNALL